MIDVVIPTLGRPDRLAAIADNVNQATFTGHRIHFVIEADDFASAAAVSKLGLTPIVNRRTPNYAGAVNTAYDLLDGDYLFTGADDVLFWRDWDVVALERFDGWAGVVGTADLFNPYVADGSHATHSLVARWYLDNIGGVVDEGPGSFLFEGYSHNYTDTEFIGTAKARARFRPCLDSVVEHRHWSGPGGVRDATVDKTEADIDFDSDLYDRRRPLWQELSR